MDAAVVRVAAGELKVWQAIMDYAAAAPPGTAGPPPIPAAYSATEGRLVQVRALPLWLLPLGLLLALLAAPRFIRRRRPAAVRS
jgi:hypothetical protein